MTKISVLLMVLCVGTKGNTMTPEQTMWQAVVYQAFSDATAENPLTPEGITAKRTANAWIRGNGRDFKDVCSHAGMDPDFLSEAYTEGRFDRSLMKSAEAKKG